MRCNSERAAQLMVRSGGRCGKYGVRMHKKGPLCELPVQLLLGCQCRLWLEALLAVSVPLHELAH